MPAVVPALAPASAQRHGPDGPNRAVRARSPAYASGQAPARARGTEAHGTEALGIRARGTQGRGAPAHGAEAHDRQAHGTPARDEKAKAPLAIDWVFAGSELYQDPATKKQVYAADEGDLITVANFGSAILDLPMASSADDADRVFVTNTEKIPPLGTEVFVTLGPRPAKANAKPGSAAARRQ